MKRLALAIALVTSPCIAASDNDREVVITRVMQIHLNHVVQSQNNEFKQYIFWVAGDDGYPSRPLTYKMDDKVKQPPARRMVDGKLMWVLDWLEHGVHHRVIAPDYIMDKSNYDIEVEARKGRAYWRHRGLNRRVDLVK